jgi:hypothetical protein
MSESVSRRGFLKATGTSVLTGTALATGGSKTPVVKKAVKPVVRKLGPEAKAYRKFLKSVKSKNLKFSDIKVISASHGLIYNEGRDAFKDATSKTFRGDISTSVRGLAHTVAENKVGPSPKGGPGTGNTYLEYVEKNVDPEMKSLNKTARNLKATEVKKTRNAKKPKKITKRGIVQSIKSKLKNIKIRGGFGGPGSGKVGIQSRTPERISGYHY